jgi:hypothetical protein
MIPGEISRYWKLHQSQVEMVVLAIAFNPFSNCYGPAHDKKDPLCHLGTGEFHNDLTYSDTPGISGPVLLQAVM